MLAKPLVSPNTARPLVMIIRLAIFYYICICIRLDPNPVSPLGNSSIFIVTKFSIIDCRSKSGAYVDIRNNLLVWPIVSNSVSIESKDIYRVINQFNRDVPLLIFVCRDVFLHPVSAT